MSKKIKMIKLENIENLSAKKETKSLVYYYLNFQFHIHKIGADSQGKDMYRLTPINFDNKLLKTFSKKNLKARGYSTIQSDNIKESLKNIFDEIIRIKDKKEKARIAYETAVKNGTLEKDAEVIVIKDATPAISPSSKKVVRKKMDSFKRNDDFKDEKSYKKSDDFKKEKSVSNDKSYSKENSYKKATSPSKFSKKDNSFKKNDDFKKDKNFSKDKPSSNGKSFKSSKPFNKSSRKPSRPSTKSSR